MKTYWTDNLKGSRGYSSDREIVLLPDHAATIEAKDVEYATLDAAFAHAVDRAEEGLTVIAAKDAEIEQLKQDYISAEELVASMHEAAVGGVIGPFIGVVEDVQTLRQWYLETERDCKEKDRRIAELEAELAMKTYPPDSILGALEIRASVAEQYAQDLTAELATARAEIQQYGECPYCGGQGWYYDIGGPDMSGEPYEVQSQCAGCEGTGIASPKQLSAYWLDRERGHTEHEAFLSGLLDSQSEERKAEVAALRAHAQRNADAAEALAGLEELGCAYELHKSHSWILIQWSDSSETREGTRPINVWHGPTPLAAVLAAEEAQG